MKKQIALLLVLITSIHVFAQTEVEHGLNAITEEAVRGQLEFLASDWTEGRAVGTKGAYIAADYIAAMFKTYGIKPFGDENPYARYRRRSDNIEDARSYYQNFSLIKYEPGEEQLLSVVSTGPGSESAVNLGYKTDFDVSTGSVGQTAQAPLVFAGYGYVNEEKGYNDLTGVDLKGKIAVILEGFPGHKDRESEAYKRFVPESRRDRYYMERNKTAKIKEAGVLGIIKIRPGQNPTLDWSQNRIYPVKGRHYEADEPLASYRDMQMVMPGETMSADIPTFTVTPRVASEIVKGTNLDFEVFEKNAAENMQPASRPLRGKSVAFKTSVISEIVKARNVLGYIEGKKKDEYIVVGAHYVHLGKWDGYIWNGADDNASGTVGVMTLAKAFMATGKKPEKTVVFAAWTAEEKGLYGSEYFVSQAKKKGMDVVLNLNYDMIGRDEESDSLKNKAHMQYAHGYDGIEEATRKNLKTYNIKLDLSTASSERVSGGSDHAPFAREDIPFFYFMAAMHPDYHQPSDEISKINWEKMTNIIRIGFLNTWEFANSDNYLKTKLGGSNGGVTAAP